jgi:hypothetical protein
MIRPSALSAAGFSGPVPEPRLAVPSAADMVLRSGRRSAARQAH